MTMSHNVLYQSSQKVLTIEELSTIQHTDIPPRLESGPSKAQYYALSMALNQHSYLTCKNIPWKLTANGPNFWCLVSSTYILIPYQQFSFFVFQEIQPEYLEKLILIYNALVIIQLCLAYIPVCVTRNAVACLSEIISSNYT